MLPAANLNFFLYSFSNIFSPPFYETSVDKHSDHRTSHIEQTQMFSEIYQKSSNEIRITQAKTPTFPRGVSILEIGWIQIKKDPIRMLNSCQARNQPSERLGCA